MGWVLLKKTIAVLLLLVALVSMSGCMQLVDGVLDILYQGGNYEHYEGYNAVDDYFQQQPGYDYAPSANVALDRPARANERAMGEPGSWTVFIYLCGADLETDAGLASENLDELLAVSLPGNVNFVVQTGGAQSWHKREIDARYSQRFLISGGRLQLLEQQDRQNMGEEKTLSDFLIWGVENYAAERMGVILWNHGGGSIDGAIYDEQYYNDSLTLLEMDNAFSDVFDYMTDRFEFVGFDACLMATIETANILVPHARYLIASEELEPGGGWDYKALAQFLAQNPGASGAELGREICDSYYDKCVGVGEGSYATLSVVDLGKVDYLINVLEDLASEIYESSADSANFAEIARSISSAQSYGGSSYYEGYSNMVDLGDMAAKLEPALGDAATALRWAVYEAVSYQIRGFAVKRATGLATYYPLSINGMNELKFFNRVSVSASYVKYVDMVAYGNSNGSLANYHYAYWNDHSAGYFSPASFSSFDALVDGTYSGGGTSGNEWESNSATIEYAVAPYLNDNGIYTLTVSQQTLDNVLRVYFSLYLEDNGSFIYIGSDSDIFVDYDTGVVEDNFRGVWPSLPDGQPLTLFVLDEDADVSRYSSPILLNGSPTNLRFEYDWNLEAFVPTGTWDGIDGDTGMSAREIRVLEDGDVITPVYQRYTTLYSEGYTEFFGEPYTIDANFDIAERTLPEGDYHYCFSIADIFGGYTETDFVVFYVDPEGEIYFNTDGSSTGSGSSGFGSNGSNGSLGDSPSNILEELLNWLFS